MWWLGWGSPLSLVAVGVFLLLLRGGRRGGSGRSDRDARLDASRAAELDELRARVAELERDRERVAELEERLDFTERLLARNKAAAPLSEGN
jgi:hypothetical protein